MNNVKQRSFDGFILKSLSFSTDGFRINLHVPWQRDIECSNHSLPTGGIISHSMLIFSHILVSFP
jgi:hypothetical protein